MYKHKATESGNESEKATKVLAVGKIINLKGNSR